MSLLAEPKRKQRLSVDPQNVQWKNDDQRVSRKLMERMGWSDGDGLGRNRQGCSENVKLKANYTGKGLGADKMASYDSTWIGHHDDFADLLSALNKNKEQKADTEEEKQEKAKKLSLELASKSLRRRIHYQKFTRAKDTSNYTDNDRSAVLGIGLSRSKAESREKTEPAEQKPDKEATISAAADSNTTVSTLSVAEYFAAKMAALKNKREQAQSADVKKEVAEDHNVEEDSKKVAESSKKKRKERRISECLKYESASESLEIKVEIVEKETVEEDDEAMRKQRKKEKKLKRKMERERLQESKCELKEPKVELEEEEDNGTLEGPADNHNKRKRKQERERETAVMEEESFGQEEKKKSKKNKRKRQESE
ncbi:unnamed protein product [Nippostrongylus brasiliensis]|uniref:PIN2/TERF1-interacting telomerase inhibitor 1 (inferred by orthology to a human protein) n=1 Tax=Nippostrongylus brasiliensis TaxID=27835 RepID=A0A0N4Y1Y0_NIPBR|nr:unnamed protein product [Nippostrongylus brasiliensis]